MKLKASIVIPTFNKLSFTEKCIERVLENTTKESNEIIVVDNNSTDGAREFLTRQQRNIFSIINQKNLGFAKACNQGAKVATGEILIFLNNDTEVQKNWLEPLLEALEDENTAVAGSKLIFPNGKIQHAGIVISKKYIPQHIYYGKKADLPYINKKREFQAVTAACMAVKKDVFNELGGFDEDYVNGLEDVDLCLKVRELGYKIVYCPESVVVHHESVSEGRFKKVDHNEQLFLKKWKGKIEPDEDKYYLEDGLGRFYSKKLHFKNKIKRELDKFGNGKS